MDEQNGRRIAANLQRLPAAQGNRQAGCSARGTVLSCLQSGGGIDWHVAFPLLEEMC